MPHVDMATQSNRRATPFPYQYPGAEGRHLRRLIAQQNGPDQSKRLIFIELRACSLALYQSQHLARVRTVAYPSLLRSHRYGTPSTCSTS
jgi:hypothetical protein